VRCKRDPRLQLVFFVGYEAVAILLQSPVGEGHPPKMECFSLIDATGTPFERRNSYSGFAARAKSWRIFFDSLWRSMSLIFLPSKLLLPR